MEQLKASKWQQYAPFLDSSYQILPFFDTHTAAKQAVLNQSKQADHTTYLMYRKHRPFLFITISGNEITNILLVQSTSIGWRTIFQFVEKMARYIWQRTCRLRLHQTVTPYLQERLTTYGYTLDSTGKTAEKSLVYHTALVLGGGGARGAYQIGVWQALRELDISIALIAGTSVGALNGALILQNDFEAAKTMWEKIDTNKVLSFPDATIPSASETLRSLLQQLGSLTRRALLSKGVSTEPLRQLINETFSETKMMQTTIDFYLVTTQLQTLQEKVIHFNRYNAQQRQAWLLASSSFFPAMAATKIGNVFYIDGGYRNNVPCDVALRYGATEYIVVDVKGPGVSKAISIPEEYPSFFLQTPWSMGNVLLFDGVRSTQNMQLGYLEAIKMFTKKYHGYWYTIQASTQEAAVYQRNFLMYLKNTYQIHLWSSTEQQKKLCQKLRKLYKGTVDSDSLVFVLIELLAKDRGILPTLIYTLQELSERILQNEESIEKNRRSIGLLSVQEWLQAYYSEYFLLSEKQQVNWLQQYLDATPADKKARIAFLIDKVPELVLKVLMYEFITKGGSN